MNITALLRKLTAIPGVSGREAVVSQPLLELLKEYCPDAALVQGNIIGTFGKRESGKPHVLLDAHFDQVGLIVTYIDENGFLKVGNLGGLDLRLFPAQTVTVHGTSDIPGVVCAMPPHLLAGDADVADITDILIDTGYSKEELEKIVSLGDMISFDAPFEELCGDRICSPALDDRCGIAAILYALSQLDAETLPCSVSVLFSAQEELGERGAKIAAYTIQPDIALAVDVSFGRANEEAPEKCGSLGGGAMIGISPSLSAEVSRDLKNIAETEQIPWQPEVMAGTTGTNADQFSVTRGGVKACTVSIPLRYMHTPAEVIALSDVTATGDLLAAYLRGCKTC